MDCGASLSSWDGGNENGEGGRRSPVDGWGSFSTLPHLPRISVKEINTGVMQAAGSGPWSRELAPSLHPAGCFLINVPVLRVG